LVELTDYFGQRVFTASEVKHGKPAPDLFLYAAEKMQVEAERCLVIEDSVMGITAATEAGMRVWRYIGARHFGFGSGNLPKQFSHVPIFDNWSMFYEMAPDLQKLSLALGDQHDD